MKYANQSKEIKINKCQAEMNREKKISADCPQQKYLLGRKLQISY